MRASGLRTAVSGPPHAERSRVVVRRLFRVPDREHHGVHPDNGKVEGSVLRWPGHIARMRTGSQTAQLLASLLDNLSINAKRMMVSLYTMTTSSPGWVDRLDADLIELLAAEPRVG